MRSLFTTVLALLMLAGGRAMAQEEPYCGYLANAYGPFDYRKERGRALGIVDFAHFNSDVRNLRHGQSGSLGGDLDYVLRASPNHHQALSTIAEWGVRLKTRQPPGLKRSIDCYFERGSRFQPDDLVVRMLYASFLQRMDQKADALQILVPLEQLDGLEAYTHQNLGMLLMDLDEPERALVQAWKARKMGWIRPGLKERLERAGKWREPPSAAGADAAASAAPASPPSLEASAPGH